MENGYLTYTKDPLPNGRYPVGTVASSSVIMDIIEMEDVVLTVFLLVGMSHYHNVYLVSSVYLCED